MAYDRFYRASRLTALTLMLATGGCSLTETTTSVRSLPESPAQTLRLVRSESAPIVAQFHQDGHSVLGQLSFTNTCRQESTQVIKRQEISDHHTKRGSATGWAVAGGAIAAVGVGMILASTSADSRVTCGEGRPGDRCDSPSSVLQEAGISTLVSGLAAAVTAGYFLAQKPQVESKDLPPERRTQTISGTFACGTTAALEGLALAVDLPNDGKWTGRVTADGAVRIDINEKISLRDAASVRVVVESVPASLAGTVTVGESWGMSLRAASSEKRLSALRPLTARAR